MSSGQAPAPQVGIQDKVLSLEAALAESTERLEKLFKASPDAITISDAQTSCYLNVSDAFTRIFGYEREEVIGKPATELGIWAHPQDRTRLVDDLRTLGRLRDFHAVGRRRDGTLRTCRLNGEFTTVAGRKCLFLIIQDITEQLQTERALKESLNRFSMAFRASPDALVLADLESGELLEVNDGFERLYGAPRATVLGRTSAELNLYADPIDRERLFKLFRQEGGFREVEVCFRCHDGSERSTLFSGEVMEVAGRAHGVVAIRDLTEQRKAELERLQLEAQLRQAQKLEALGTLAGGIAHDFNNILTAILAYSDLALLDIEHPSEVRSSLDEVRKAGLRARELVRQILSFSRMQKEDYRAVRIADVVSEAVRLLRSSLPATVRMEYEGLADTGLVVHADPTQIHQVVMNLGTNATHAMRGRPGVLGFRLSRLDAGGPPRVCIEISDTGCGMPEAVRSRIFEPFFTTKPQGEGTGLGLSVVLGIVRAHGGTIDVESREGLGTTVRVCLPLHDSAADEPEEGRDELVPGRGESILFIDDEEALCGFAQKLFSRLGYRVRTCTNPLEALELLVPGQCSHDLVVTDLTMPHLTGLDVARRVQDARLGIPVLMCSGLPGSIASENLRRMGVHAMLTKPVLPHALASEVRRLLDEQAGARLPSSRPPFGAQNLH